MANKTFSIVDTAERVDAAVAALCGNRGYRDTVQDPAFPADPTKTVPNPVSREQFAGAAVVAFCEDEVRGWAQKQADAAANAAKEQALAPLRAGVAETTIG